MTRDAGGDPEALRAALFDSQRLEAKMRCFRTAAAPSIATQLGENPILWLIYTSPSLPQPHSARLNEIAAGAAQQRERGGAGSFAPLGAPSSSSSSSSLRFASALWPRSAGAAAAAILAAPTRAEVVRVRSMGEFSADVAARVEAMRAAGLPFATVRLDDDDGLHPSYATKLQRYASRVGDVVTFPQGRKYTITPRPPHSMLLGAPMCWKLIALGLARIGDNIHACGDHTKIAQRFRVHEDNAPGMYICFCGHVSDTKREFTPAA